MLKLFAIFILIMTPLSALGEPVSIIEELGRNADEAQSAADDVRNNRKEISAAKEACRNDGGTVAGGACKYTSNKPRKDKTRATGKVARPKVDGGKSASGSLVPVKSAYSSMREAAAPPLPGGGNTPKTGTSNAAKRALSNKPAEEPATEGDSGNVRNIQDFFVKETKENRGVYCGADLGEDDGVRDAEAKLINMAAKPDLAPRIEQCKNNPEYHGAYNKGERRYLIKSGCTYSAGAAQARQQQEKGGAIPPHDKRCHSITRKMSDMYAAGWTDVNNKAKGIEAKAAGIAQEEAEEMRAYVAAAEYADAHPSEKIDWGAVLTGATKIASDISTTLLAQQAAKDAAEDERGRRNRADVARQNAQIAADNANARRNSTYTNHIGGGSSSSNSGGGGYSGSGGGGGPTVCTHVGTFGKLENGPCP